LTLPSFAVDLHSGPLESDQQATIVVAGTRDGRYMIGRPAGDVLAVLIPHLAGIGPVNTSTFDCESHDVLVEPASFPMELGHTWTTEWYTGELEAAVEGMACDVIEPTLA
jgi:hypothetical protein